MELFNDPVIPVHTYDELFGGKDTALGLQTYNSLFGDSTGGQTLIDPVIVNPTTTSPAAFVLTVSGTLTVANSVAPTLEATNASKLIEIKARVRTVSSSGSVVIRVKKNTISIGTVTILANQFTGLTSFSSAINFGKNDQVDIDITSAGVGAKDLSVFIRVQ